MGIRDSLVKRHRRYCYTLLFFISGLALADTPPASSGDQPPSAEANAVASGAIPPDSFLNNFTGIPLVDQRGHAFVPDAFMGRVVLFNFIYTNCGSTCPLQTRALAKVMRRLPADARRQVRFVSVSIDPGNDTPEQLKRFAKKMGADLAGWSFLTGEAAQIERLTARLHIFDESETGQAYRPQIHRTSLWLVDKQGRMLQRYQGDPPDEDRLVRELAQVSHLSQQ